MKKYEYAQHYLNPYDTETLGRLNEMGEQGWEVISVTPHSVNNMYYYTYKREIELGFKVTLDPDFRGK